MTLTPGTRLGSYEIISPLGSGGMGEVYRARDTRPAMAREVAIKVLVGAVSDESSQHRFEQEARAMSALSHPNIISIYDIGTYAGALYLVEELVEGVTLRALTSKGPLSTQRVVDYACAIARGLAAAHAKGITHRDLKPENVMVTSGGLVKILDFGLAKVWSAPPDSDSSTQAHQTGPGTIVGTVAYMAPEQLRAQSVDHRTDLFSLGIVLYEMLAGVRPFVGDTAVDTQAAILNLEPRGFEPQHHIPPLIEQIVLRCLEKNPAKRFQSASDLEFALTMALNRSGLQNSPLDQGPRRVTPWAAAAAVAALAGLLGFYLRVPERSSVQPPKQPPTRFELTTPPDGSLHLTGDEPDVAISRDGRRIAYLSSTNGTSTGRRLFLRELGRLEAIPISGTTNAREPFFSPDGEWIGFENSRDVSLRKVPITGGTASLIAKIDNPIQGATWLDDDSIVFATRTGKGLMKVAASGGIPEQLTEADASAGDIGHFWPSALPDRGGLLFVRWRGSEETSEIDLWTPETKATTTLIRGASSPHYVPPGYIVYGSGGTLRATPFDSSSMSVAQTTPRAIVTGVNSKSRYGAVNFDVAENGAIAYVMAGDAGLRSVVEVDRQGTETDLGVPPRVFTSVRASADGQRLALVVREPKVGIWTWDTRRRLLAPLPAPTVLTGEIAPAWSPDGTRLAFASGNKIYEQASDGSGSPRVLLDDPLTGTPTYTPDGQGLIFQGGQVTANNPPYDIWFLSLINANRRRLWETDASEASGVVSPNGKWLAYQSDESSRPEVYVRPFPDVTRQRFPVSSDGGTRPVWSRDGRELFYYVEPGTIWVAPIQSGSPASVGTPRVLFRGTYPSLYGIRHYDVSADGRHFTMLKPAESVPSKIGVVLNWLSDTTGSRERGGQDSER